MGHSLELTILFLQA